MQIKLYGKENIVEVIHDTDAKSVTVNWTNLGPHDFLRPAIEAQVKCGKEKDIRSVIVNTGKAKGVPSQEDQVWFGSYVFPEMQKGGCKAIITVLPESAIGKLAAGQWSKTGQQFGMDFINTATFEDAYNLAKGY